MDREDIQHLAEEIFSLQVQSSEASDREDYGASQSLEHEASGLETQLEDAGYTLEDDKDNLDIFHVLDAQGERYGSFDLASWTWIEEA